MMNHAMLFLSDEGITDPFKSDRTYFSRNNGPVGSESTSSDEGGVTWGNIYPGRSLISNGWSYWADSYGYGRSRFYFGMGWVCNPSLGHVNTPFRIVGQRTSEWSMMLRGQFYKDANNIIREIGIGSSSDFGPNSTQFRITSPLSGSGRVFTVTVGGVGSDVGTSMTSPVHPLGQATELLVTKKYNSATGQATYRLFINGALEASMTVTQADSINPTGMRVTAAAYMFDSPGLDGSREFYLSDDIFWQTCIATAAYTPAILPFE